MSRRPPRRAPGRAARPLWLLLLLAALLLVTLWPRGAPAGGGDALELLFLDVGQGDATLLRTPDGRTALVDGGRSPERLLELLGRVDVARLDLVIATHADFDHIAGLVDAIERYPTAAVVDNGVPHTTQTYARLLDTIEDSGARYLRPTSSELRRIRLGERVELRLLPPPLLDDDQNGNSVGVLIDFGAFEALLPGDATRAQQGWWLERYEAEIGDLDLYKAAHHGSSTGDDPWFLAALRPETVVISAGRDNPYGHPHREALAAYRGAGAAVYRTDEQGTVTVLASEDGGWSVATGVVGATPTGGVRRFVEDFVRELLRLELER